MTRIANNRKIARQEKMDQLLTKASSITLKLKQLYSDLDIKELSPSIYLKSSRSVAYGDNFTWNAVEA